jgi:hypothetical protein
MIGAAEMVDLHNARDQVDRAWLHKLLDQLLDLRDRTDPNVCSDVATVPVLDPPPATITIDGREMEVTDVFRGKDECASWAVAVAARLFVSVVGWAINHAVGKAIANDGVDCNSHELECIGQEAGRQGCLDEPAHARAALLAILPGFALPWSLAHDLRDALIALDLGEAMPLLRPAATGRHGKPYSLAKLRMNVIEYVNFRYGQVGWMERVLEDVAGQLGVAPETLRTWQNRDLRKIFGAAEVDKCLKEARDVGQFIEEVRHDEALMTLYNSTVWVGTHEWTLLYAAARWERLDLGEIREALTRHGGRNDGKSRYI